MTLSVIIIAKNEADNIRRCLTSVQWVDEIIVLDSGSTDETVDIAKEFTPHVFVTDWPGYGAQKERALMKATGDWVLNLDADEYIDETLKSLILSTIFSNAADAYRIPIRLNFYGQALKYSASPKRHIRLFKRFGAHFSADIVHEKIILPQGMSVKHLDYPIMHHSFRDLSHAIEKMNRYSSYSAKIRIEGHKKAHFRSALLGCGWMFFRCYILQRGFLDGRAGFILAFYSAQASFYRALKQIYQDQAIAALPSVTSEPSQ